jgi:hypothetical protein
METVMSNQKIVWYVSAAMLFCAILCYGIFASITHFECSHTNQTCSYTSRSPWRYEHNQVNFGQIEAVTIDSTTSRSGKRTVTRYRVVLQTHTGQLPTSSRTTQQRDSLEQFAQSLETFLADSSKPNFEHIEDNRLLGNLLGVALAVMAVAIPVISVRLKTQQ